MSEEPLRSEERAPRPGRGEHYLSALLVVAALVVIVSLSRPRQTALLQAGTQPLGSAAAAQQSPPVPTPSAVTVHVVGEVQEPDVYTLPTGSRVKDAIRAAGGMTAKADTLAVNQALLLRDEAQVSVPARGQSVPQTAPTPGRGTSDGEAEIPGEVVNLNTATQAQLESLPGIGPSKAEAILEYRRVKGPFRKAENLQEVPGIGPAIWEKLKDRVKV